MRTIKDPKRKPEVRRRTDYEEEEEDCRSTKSTPPKKRKTANSKATANDNSSLNDSGSFVDSHSDILSERSRDDDASDISSMKSTPPKKRNYSKLLKQSPEINGEVHANVDSQEIKQEGKPKASKKIDKKAEVDTKPVDSVKDAINNKKVSGVKKPTKGGKKEVVKEAEIEKSDKNHVKDDVQDIKKSPKGRKVKTGKQEVEQQPEEKTPAKKKVANRKRKLIDEDDGDTKKEESPKQSKTNAKEKVDNEKEIDIAKTAEIQSKKLKKSKKQLKEEATLELKRQTEEQRNAHSLPSKESETQSKKKKVTPKKKITKQVDSVLEESKDTLVTLKANKIEEIAESKENEVTRCVDTESNQTKNVQKSEPEASVQNHDLPKPFVLSETPLNDTYLYGVVDEEDDSSDLDTSFESINSVSYNSDRKQEDIDKSHLDDVEQLNDSLETKPGDSSESNLSIKCNRCGYISRSKGGHTRHLRKCQPEQLGLDGESKHPKMHVCEKCEYIAPRRVLVINHMKTHGIYQCKRCQYRTDNEETLTQHSGLEHKDRSDCKFCKLCNRYVKCSDIPLEKHMEECQGRIPFKCPECNKEFQYESSLKCHVVSHYPDQPKLFSCDQCDYKSNYKANLKKHIRHIHEERGEKSIKCPDCDKCFHTDDNMRRHQKLHSEERPHKCEQEGCTKAFKTFNGLKFHLISHQTDRPFLCEVEGCNKGFKSKKSLVMHLNETHQNAPKNFHCTEEGCDMAFYKKCHFERHMAAHTDNRMYFCRWITCTKAFRTAESLKTHMLVHTNEKPVKCEHCDYSCRQRNSIRFHMKKKHPELIPHDLIVSKEPLKQSSLVSDPTMTTFKVAEGGSAVTDLANCLDNKENLDELLKNEHSSLISSPINSPKSSQVTESTNKINHVKNKLSKNKTKNSNPLPSPLDRLSNHAIQNHISSNEIKQNVPSNENKESSPVLANQSTPHLLTNEKSEKGSIANETPGKKPKKTDMYEFMSEDESEDEMKPGLLRRDYDRDKPPLPPVTGKIDPSLLSDLNLPQLDSAEKPSEEKPQKTKKKPGPKPKVKPEAESEVKVPKKRGRKKKSEVEKADKADDKESDSVGTEVVKPKRGRSPKGKKETAKKSKDKNSKDNKPGDEGDYDNQKDEKPEKKKRGPKKKIKAKEEKVPEKVPKKRGRKKKGKLEERKDIEPENGDATINYSEVESDKMFADSKDGVSDLTEGPLSNLPFSSGLKLHDSDEEGEKDLNTSTDKNDELISENGDEIGENKVLDGQINNQSDNKTQGEDEAGKQSDKSNDDIDTNEAKNTSLSEKEEEKRYSDADSESSDIGSDFDEDLKPPPAPRPPPMYDSEDGDIESGPENEDCNGSSRSNERIRDFESSREISREISRDFESSREIDDSVKTYDPNSVDTSTPKDALDTPSSVNPYKNDSVGNDFDNQETPHPHSHHSSVPHTPSHSSIPPTPVNNQDYESKNHPEETVIKSVNVQGQTNDENTDESSMPEVDKDYVGRFFEEIQCNPPEQITRLNNMDESRKSQEKVTGDSTQSDSGVPSSLTSNQTEASIQMQSPPTDLSHKRMDILPAERPVDEPFQTRPDSVQRIPERIPSVPTYEPQFNSIDPYASASLPPRDTILRQTDQTKIPSPLNASSSTSSSFMRFPDSDAMLQRQRMTTPYDRNIQNLHRITDTAIPSHNNSSTLLRHVPGREDVFPGSAGVPGSMARNPFHASWTGQDVQPPHWGHPAYLQRPLDQQAGSTPSSLFGKDSYLPGREFMFDPTRAAAERNMFSSLASSHTQRPEIPHDTFQLERFDLGSYLSSHAYNTAPSLPVDYTRSAHSSAQKSLDERYRQSSTGVTDFRTLPQSSTASDMFGMNSSFNLDKFYSRETMYHSQHISDNTNNPFLPGVPGQHSMFSRDYTHRSFYTQNSAYPFVNMNDKNFSAAASAKHSASAVGQPRELVPVPRPNMAHDPQLQDPYRHSSMLYNMMNRYFEG